MSYYTKAFGWALAIILIAVASRNGFFNEEVADILMMAMLVACLSIGFPRSCGGRAGQGN